MSSISNFSSGAIRANLINSSENVYNSVLNLTSGIKSNASVADFSVGTLLSYQASAIATANVNAGQGKSLANTARSALNNIVALLQNQKSLATKALDDSLSDNQRANLNLQFQANADEINRIANNTKFNNRKILDGSISGIAELTTATGQTNENYTLLSTGDYSFSGTTKAGNLATSNVFSAVDTNNVGLTSGYATLSFVGAVGAGTATNAVVQINGQSITFTSGVSDITAATNFVAAAEASTNASIRKFTYRDNGDGTVLVTGADLGNNATTGADSLTFALTNKGTGTALNTDAVTFGGANIDTTGAGTTRTITSNGTVGTNRSVAADDVTYDANLQGRLTNFTATLDTSGTQNRVIFTTDINGQVYTSEAVTLFGTGGYNSKGNTIKSAQVITFHNLAAPTDGYGTTSSNAFNVTVGVSDIVVSGISANLFQTSLNTIAAGFDTQLEDNRINQNRSLIFSESNAIGGNFTIAASGGTIFSGIQGFDAVGVNAKGDINLIGDVFGTDGNNSGIGPFNYDLTTNELTTTIGGLTYTAKLSATAGSLGALTTEGLVTGTGGAFNSAANILTVGTAGTVLVLHSDDLSDGKRLQIDLTNVDAGDINLGNTQAAAVFTNALNKLFGVANNQSLTFQIGEGVADTINLALNAAKTTFLYKDDAGAGKTLDVSTAIGAAQASDVLDNALNSAISLLTQTEVAINSFSSAINTNNVLINNYQASSSSLLDTDYAEESSKYAEASLQYNAGISVLAQEQNRLQGLLKLLSF